MPVRSAAPSPQPSRAHRRLEGRVSRPKARARPQANFGKFRAMFGRLLANLGESRRSRAKLLAKLGRIRHKTGIVPNWVASGPKWAQDGRRPELGAKLLTHIDRSLRQKRARKTWDARTSCVCVIGKHRCPVGASLCGFVVRRRGLRRSRKALQQAHVQALGDELRARVALVPVVDGEEASGDSPQVSIMASTCKQSPNRRKLKGTPHAEAPN